MKKILLILSIISIIITSCSTNDYAIAAPQTNKDQVLILPRQIIYSTSGNVNNDIENIIYNGNKIVEIIRSGNNNSEKSVFTYINDLITKVERFESNLLSSVEDFVYTNEKLTTRFFWENRSSSSSNSTTIYKEKSTFSYNGNLVTEQIYKFENNDYVLTSRNIIYTIVNNNIVNEIINDTSTFGGFTTFSKTTVNYEYDTKNNPNQNILGLSKINFFEDLSVNNVTKITTTLESTTNGVLNPAQAPDVRNYLNTYNTSNFLTESKYDFQQFLPTSPPTFETRTRITKYIY